MHQSGRGPRWLRPAAIGGIAALMAWFAFGMNREVPLFDWFDLAIHETGHLLAAALPEIAMFLAGSVAQVAFPLAMAGYFAWRRRDPVAIGFCLVWAGTSLWDVSVYARDAVAQNLPLVGGGRHDWAYILGHFDALPRTHQAADTIERSGLLVALAGIALIAWALAAALRPIADSGARSKAGAHSGPARPSEDPWVAAARLPFRYEGGESPVGAGGVATGDSA